MKKIKLAFVLLAAIIAMAVMPANVLAVSGEGTEASPYVITSASDLEFIRSNLSSHFALGGNITLSSAWTAIGEIDNPFTGSFDGRGYTISGLKVTASGKDVYAGLFGLSEGDIKNLKIVMAASGISATATGHIYAGGIVAYNNGGVIENCNVTGTISVSASTSENDVAIYAGLVAGRSEGKIESTTTNGSVTATVTETSAIKTVANNAQVYAGGIVGLASADMTDNMSVTDVTVIANTTSDYMPAKAYAGGIAGECIGNISKCKALGNVSAKSTASALEAAAYAGGLVGYENGNIEISAAFGNVTAETAATSARTYAGGVVGYISGNIAKVYALGNAESKATTTNDAVYAGGLAGLSYGRISTSYATGTAKATAANALAGGLAGFISTATVDSYYMESNKYTTYAGCGNEKSEDELKLQETYENWDFSTTWKIKDNENEGYPYLIDISNIQGLFEDVEYTYDGTEKTIVVTNLADNVTVSYINNKATKAGVYRAVATLTAEDYSQTQLIANLIINPIVLTIKGLDVKDKEYDNTTKAELDISNVVIEGVLPGEDVRIDAENSVANFVTENVGNGRQAIISEIKFVGADASNYTAGMYYAEADILEGTYDFVTFEGSGTKEDPYLISDEDELNAIRGNLDAHFKLVNNIVLEDTWVPIGKLNAPFTGSFDGGNYTISGISVDRTIGYYYSGLFGYNAGTISNVNLLINDNISTTTQNAYIGAVAGYNNGTIDNCIVNGTIETSPVSTYVYVGGITGYNNGTVKFCESNVEIVAKGSTVYAGGVAGENNAKIEKTSSTGMVTVNDSLFAYVGGFVGISNYEISDCYSMGDVAVNVSDTAFMVDAAGFAGRVESGRISNSYSIGRPEITVESGAYLLTEATGGFSSYNAGIITNSYYDSTTSGQTDTGKGVGKTTAELKTWSTFTGWDSDVWEISEFSNEGYPYLTKTMVLTEKALLAYSGKTATVSAYSDIISATIIVASYSEGALVDIDFNENFTIEKGQTLTYKVKDGFKEVIGGTVKVMLWKNFATATPLCTYKEVSIR